MVDSKGHLRVREMRKTAFTTFLTEAQNLIKVHIIYDDLSSLGRRHGVEGNNAPDNPSTSMTSDLLGPAWLQFF